MSTLKLYTLAEQYNELQTMLDLTDDPEAIRDTLESVEDAFDSKVESIIKLWRQYCGERDFVKQERYRLEEMEKRAEKKANWLKNYVETQMKLIGKTEIKSSLFSIKLQNNPEAVDVYDEETIPEKFKKLHVETKLDKQAIKEAIKNGEDVPGAGLRQEKSIRIR